MDNMLPILAIETSGEMCSAAVLLDGNSFVEMNFLQKHIHSKKIIDIIDSVIKNCNLEINNIKAIAISGGPGSFTGLRIGFSIAKGLALGAGIPIIPVPTYDALALQISKSLYDGLEFVVANKASIEEVYYSKYSIDGQRLNTINEVKSIHKNELDKFIGDTKNLFGNSCNNPVHLNASSVATWAYLFGRDLLTFDYDYLEPEYFGNPFLKNKESEGK